MDAARDGRPERRRAVSGTYRTHPFQRPSARRSAGRPARCGRRGRGAPRVRRPRPYFQRPPDEDTSEDENVYDYIDGDSSDSADDYDSDYFTANRGPNHGAGDAMDTDAPPERAPEGGAPQDYLTAHLRAIEVLPESAPHRSLLERTARTVYAQQFPPRDLSAGSKAPAQRARRSLRGFPRGGGGGQEPGPDDEGDDAADLREDLVPDEAYAHLERDERLSEGPPLLNMEAAAAAAGERSVVEELFTYAPAQPQVEVPLPRILEGRVRPSAFFAQMSLDALCRTPPNDQRVARERRAWEMAGTPHGLLITTWSTVDPEFSIGGMYVGAPEGTRPRLVWRRAMKQAMALQYRLGVGGLCRAVDGAACRPLRRCSFWRDALLRECATAIFCRGRGARAAPRRLPRPAVGLLAATQFTPPDASPHATLFRGSMGSLIYWHELRVMLTAVPALCARYAGAGLQSAELYLLALRHSEAPGYTANERYALSAYLTLFVALAERGLRWLYLAGAHLLGPHPTAAAFREVRAKIPYERLPLGSATLHDAEVETVDSATFQEALAFSALAHVYGEAYVAVRTATTLLMAEYAVHAERRDVRQMTAAFLGVGLIAQRLMGSLNLLLNCVAGAAVYGGRRVTVREGTLARYSLLADAALPLVRPVFLVEFREARDGVMRELRLRPVASPPLAGKRRVMELYLSLDSIEALVGREPLGSRPVLGPLVDIAEALADHPHLVTGDGRGPRLGGR
ncbi:virion protein (tegument [Bovine herpesvirus type 1.1 (strain 34)]|uniref:Tegument protein UL47 n=1 Tax=Bovine herpesvirus 1.1 (strain Cooper) TaxID=10323 RepID=TEG5_BHV1C|nr:RecName: Full=Tegument protein UL47 [Bovine herpesvirus type 1.1 (strain Cooper)]AAA46064.1 tegument protein [Bovine alphaherpesvirus 1]UOW86821.1 MAG: UL47 protein [Bovine alphaherpesvirus 1]CAA06087.1 virion protein (tegument [Bovine herpesvirus type 1.1]CAA90922.1 UL47 [Bovine alphaherpesvirus 1]